MADDEDLVEEEVDEVEEPDEEDLDEEVLADAVLEDDDDIAEDLDADVVDDVDADEDEDEEAATATKAKAKAKPTTRTMTTRRRPTPTTSRRISTRSSAIASPPRRGGRGRGGRSTPRTAPRPPGGCRPGAGEFVCQSCFLVKHPSQLADDKAMLCADCVMDEHG